ncbi:MAG: reductase [Burkholderiaceae bacterium]
MTNDAAPLVLGDAGPHDAPIAYLERVRSWYLALGYGTPYAWAHYASVPFAPLAKPLAACRVAVVTTAAPHRPDAGDAPPGVAYHAAAKFFDVYSRSSATDPRLRIDHVAIDFDHTRGDDSGSFFPLAALREAAAAGRIGELAPRWHGLPTQRSQRRTLERDVPELLARCRADAVDAALLVPNCPVCHQSVSLAARALEAEGIATVVMGCAKDIVERVGVPRLLFSDFPLGNGAGRPHDRASQRDTLELALRLLEQAFAPRTTVQSPLRWSEPAEWKLDYCNAERLSAAELAQRRAAFDAAKRVAAGLRRDDGA